MVFQNPSFIFANVYDNFPESGHRGSAETGLKDQRICTVGAL